MGYKEGQSVSLWDLGYQWLNGGLTCPGEFVANLSEEGAAHLDDQINARFGVNMGLTSGALVEIAEGELKGSIIVKIPDGSLAPIMVDIIDKLFLKTE